MKTTLQIEGLRSFSGVSYVLLTPLDEDGFAVSKGAKLHSVPLQEARIPSGLASRGQRIGAELFVLPLTSSTPEVELQPLTVVELEGADSGPWFCFGCGSEAPGLPQHHRKEIGDILRESASSFRHPIAELPAIRSLLGYDLRKGKALAHHLSHQECHNCKSPLRPGDTVICGYCNSLNIIV